MLIQKLDLSSFRNYQRKELTFFEKTTLLVGPNTIGKTNLLEAIYLLATGKSFKAGLDNEMISYDSEIGRIKGEIVEDEKINLEIMLTCGLIGGERTAKKKFLVNGIARRMSDFVGNLKAVYFRPEDLDLVTDSPSLRRRYLDQVLFQVDREYVRSSISFEKGLRQRNRLLENIRENGAPRSQLLFWNQLLIKNGEYITKLRQEYLDFINSFEQYNYQVEYDKSVISPSRLEEYAEEEIAAAATLVGPHRDDFIFKLKGRDLNAYGSRGEQRMGVLWLKLCELEFIASKTGTRPILLLDDIFSELDEEHRNLVLEIIPEQQTIITTTDLELVEKKVLKDIEVLKLG
jgi:DNA replication and repair protein RecF